MRRRIKAVRKRDTSRKTMRTRIRRKKNTNRRVGF